MKRLAVFFDGTWNAPEQLDITSGTLAPLAISRGVQLTSVTNVVKLMRAVEPMSSRDQQIVMYVPGVGLEGFVASRLVGGMFGWGISKNILSAYMFIDQNFVAGDHIFFFGFSRGAYTARSLAGFLDETGFIRRDKLHLIPVAYAKYMEEFDVRHDVEWEPLLRELRGSNEKREIPIYFVGVWDTVGAVGPPSLGKLFPPSRLRRDDYKLPQNVTHAYHALALHEVRSDFEPVLWTELCPNHNVSQIEQVWFSGAHADVGGGYTQCGLSDIALKWLACKAMSCGLALNVKQLAATFAPRPDDPVTNSHTRMWFLHGWPNTRRILPTGHSPGLSPTIVRTIGLHESVAGRLGRGRRVELEPWNRFVATQVRDADDRALELSGAGAHVAFDGCQLT